MKYIDVCKKNIEKIYSTEERVYENIKFICSSAMENIPWTIEPLHFQDHSMEFFVYFMKSIKRINRFHSWGKMKRKMCIRSICSSFACQEYINTFSGVILKLIFRMGETECLLIAFALECTHFVSYMCFRTLFSVFARTDFFFLFRPLNNINRINVSPKPLSSTHS